MIYSEYFSFVHKFQQESSSIELLPAKSLVSGIQEPVWDTEYNEDLNVPVPDLYPELSESLQNRQDSETEQVEIAKGLICSFICYAREHILFQFLSPHIKKKQSKKISAACIWAILLLLFVQILKSTLLVMYLSVSCRWRGKAEHRVGI